MCPRFSRPRGCGREARSIRLPCIGRAATGGTRPRRGLPARVHARGSSDDSKSVSHVGASRTRRRIRAAAQPDLAGARRRPGVTWCEQLLHFSRSADRRSFRLRRDRERRALGSDCLDRRMPALVAPHERHHAGRSRRPAHVAAALGSVSPVTAPPLLSAARISKSYAGVRALSDVSFDLAAGEVHALVGENGAGKSTLIKVMTGAVAPDSGTLSVAGRVVPAMTPSLSRALGIAAIYQQPALFPHLTIAENIALAL